jgi:hypothetical protein
MGTKMALKKAEMEAHRREYQSRMAEAFSAERKGLYRAAVAAALSAWDFIDGMMQYERKYEERQFASVSAIDMILKYAPLLLDFRCLDRLEGLLEDFKRIERDTSDDLGERLKTARAQMWDNRRLWEHLELHPGARQDELRQVLGNDQEYWRSVCHAWDRMGLLQRIAAAGSYTLTLSTRLGQVISAKCPSCGNRAQAPKAMFLEQLECQKCGTAVLFVILSDESNDDQARE